MKAFFCKIMTPVSIHYITLRALKRMNTTLREKRQQIITSRSEGHSKKWNWVRKNINKKSGVQKEFSGFFTRSLGLIIRRNSKAKKFYRKANWAYCIGISLISHFFIIIRVLRASTVNENYFLLKNHKKHMYDLMEIRIPRRGRCVATGS